MNTSEGAADRSAIAARIDLNYLRDEAELVGALAEVAVLQPIESESVVRRAASWVSQVRAARSEQSLLDTFMRQYDLSTEEGVVLMCLAEALLRIPDEVTAEKLISDKLSESDWNRHLGKSESILVNAGTWGLMLSGGLLRLSEATEGSVYNAFKRIVGKSSEPMIKMAVRHAMRMIGTQFVLGRTIEEALKQASSARQKSYLHSFDMLGEAALTRADADRYFAAYMAAIAAISATTSDADVFHRPSISIKLSALHPRYEYSKTERVMNELAPRLLELAIAARKGNIGLTIDAEEADRLSLSLNLFEQVFCSQEMRGWNGFGLVVQAFQKRAPDVIEFLQQLASRENRIIPLRLVKGAYWDTEIKRSQEQGLNGFPVYTSKVHTDIAYLACARTLLKRRDLFYPMFASHNANTISSVIECAGDASGYEFQRLHGMGESLYKVVLSSNNIPCRVYAPVGSHEDLLPYLVRRLLENGANSSFVNRIYDETLPAEILVADPVAQLRQKLPVAAVTLPIDLFPDRQNSRGLNFASAFEVAALINGMQVSMKQHQVQALVAGPVVHQSAIVVVSPTDTRSVLGSWKPTDPSCVPEIISAAHAGFESWSRLTVESRAAILMKAGDVLEARREEFILLLCTEAGKTLPDAVAEVREAVDFCRYYAVLAQKQLRTTVLPGPTGEQNELQYRGKGVFVCISPWNFPLAIFVGQVVAALVVGNSVVAKPAEQTNIVAAAVVGLLHDAGVPRNALQLVMGDEVVGKALTAAKGTAGVIFTGSVAAAKSINRSLAMRDGPIATLVAETGGQNAMIVDSSALAEQVVKDAIQSAFYSAGQRCSALRVLFVQTEIADKVVHLLMGGMAELKIGNPADPATDIGPIIDQDALARLQTHKAEMEAKGKLKYQCALPADCTHGHFFGPCLVELESLAELQDEIFGPILHVVRFDAKDIGDVAESINASGYGLTLGLHSRINHSWQQLHDTIAVGNTYINRSMTGAVVGSQPFGGEGLSGTGPKAGGPNYLMRLVTERVLTVNTAAVGGNAALLAGAA